MNVGSELYVILDRKYRHEKKRLLSTQTSDDVAVYAAVWLLVRCGGVLAHSFLTGLVEVESALGQSDDLPSLSIAGFRLNAGGRLSGAELARVQSALHQVIRRKPHTDELSGPADDLLSLLGILLLAEEAAPKLVEELRAWTSDASPSPSLRAALILASVESFEPEVQLDVHSPVSLAAYLLIAVADEALERRLFPVTRGSDIASQFATVNLGSVRPGSFDALAVLVTLELLMGAHASSGYRSQTPAFTTAAAQAHAPPGLREQEKPKAVAHSGHAILLVLANPLDTDVLHLGREERVLRESIRLSTHRDRIKLESLHAATIDALRRALLQDQYDIVHFSGHGKSLGLGFENEVGELEVPDSDALAALLHRHCVKTVLLNACDSLEVGLAMTSQVDHTIAMSERVTDDSAIEFSRGFYDALGEGLSVPEAFDEGVSCCRLKKLGTTAVLRSRNDNAKGEDDS